MQYDIVIIGSGPGGYVAAIRAAQLGFKTAIVEKSETLGGTCLNVGCIPSKALLDSTEHYHNAETTFAEHGIELKDLKANLPQMIKRKQEVVDQNTAGVKYLMDKNKIDVHHGLGSFLSSTQIKVTDSDGKETVLTTKNVIIATGSEPNVPSSMNYDGKRVITSTEALEIQEIPKSMVVVGGGVIGLELGSVYGRLGTEITVIEYADRILPTMDNDCSREIKKTLKKIGFTFLESHAVTGVSSNGKSVKVEYQKRDTTETQTIEVDYCLVAIGRKPHTDNLGLENIGITPDERGFISVNEHWQTSVPNVFAIGDVIGGAMLAHKAEDEGVSVCEWIAGQKPHIDYNLIPGVVYTWPEIASVGQTEEQLKQSGVSYKKGKFSYKALGRARASMDIDGFVKVLADEVTDEILGVHMVGARAADMIEEAVVAMEYRASAEDIARICHPHPTYTEAFKEACLDATSKRALHF